MKKRIYLFLTIILCLLLSTIAYQWLYFSYQHIIPCRLFYVIGGGLTIISCIGGLFLGKYRRNVVYIQKRHRSDLIKKRKKHHK